MQRHHQQVTRLEAPARGVQTGTNHGARWSVHHCAVPVAGHDWRTSERDDDIPVNIVASVWIFAEAEQCFFFIPYHAFLLCVSCFTASSTVAMAVRGALASNMLAAHRHARSCKARATPVVASAAGGKPILYTNERSRSQVCATTCGARNASLALAFLPSRLPWHRDLRLCGTCWCRVACLWLVQRAKSENQFVSLRRPSCSVRLKFCCLLLEGPLSRWFWRLGVNLASLCF